MFKIGKRRLTWIDVKWNGLDPEGHQIENAVELQVDLVDRDQFQQQLDAEAESGSAGADFVVKVTAGWRGVGDADGEVLPFTAANLRALLQCPGVLAAVGRAYGAAWMGQGKERAGNLDALPDAGGTAADKAAKPAR